MTPLLRCLWSALASGERLDLGSERARAREGIRVMENLERLFRVHRDREHPVI
jgi:hypothetical protein